MTTPQWIAGEPVDGADPLEVRSPYDDRLVSTTTYATPEQVEQAVAAADGVKEQAAGLPIHVRAAALRQVSARLRERADEIADLITSENGKPLLWAKGEVGRAVSVFEIAADETRRWSGEVMRLDTDETAEGRLAYVRQVPRGPVLAISPFNFPLNLVAHKVAPAIAVGAPVVVKPAPKTPLSALLLGELLSETELPAGMVSVVNVPNEQAAGLVADERLPVISFTGSGPVGWSIADTVPRKHVVLELGGNAAAVVCADWNTDDQLDWAAERIALYSNYQAGQSCIAVQRVLVAASLYDDFRARLLDAVGALVVGDPADPATQVGPVIDDAAADRIESWVTAAVDAGATVATGGKRDGTTIAPTVLEDVPRDQDVSCSEVFGPVMVLERFGDVDDAVRRVNDSAYGLQAGVFTGETATAFRMHRDLEVGGVVVGDVPSYRADQMPYGGVKESGVGREGVRYTMRDYTYERVMVLTGLPL